jgi:hypothetical protein
MIVKGRIIADSGEGYKTKAKLKWTLDAFIERICFANYTVEDITETNTKRKKSNAILPP